MSVIRATQSRIGGRIVGASVLVVLIGILGAACAPSEEPTATPAPTVVPTDTPEPEPFRPITADLEAEPLAFFAAISAFERNCLVEAVGQVRFDEITSGMEPTEEEGADLLACLSGVTFGRILAGGLINGTELDSLASTTLDCMEERFAAVTPSDLFGSIEDLAGEDAVTSALETADAAFRVILPAFFCLDEDERRVLDEELAAGLDEGFAPTITQIECVYESIGEDGLAGLFGNDGPSDLFEGDTPLLELFNTLAECGFDVDDFSGTLPIPKDEVSDLDIPDLSDLELPEGFDLTAEQFACLQDAGVIEQITSGEFGLEILSAAAECGVELPGLPSGGLSGLFGQ